MGLSGFLYVAIVVGWAVYLVPFALKRYDEATRNRSIDRFSSAMRVLGRRDGGRAEPAPVPPSEGRPLHPVPRATANRAAGRVAARRRRRVLLLLLFATAATAGVAAYALVPWWSVAIPGGLVVVWLLLCRRQVRRERRARPAYPVSGEREVRGSGYAEDPAEAGMAARSAEDATVYVPLHPPVQVPPNDEPTVVLHREDLDLAGPRGDTGQGSLWDPVPVTLPTYVHKTRAPRTIRTVELHAPGGGSGAGPGAPTSAAAQQPGTPAQDQQVPPAHDHAPEVPEDGGGSAEESRPPQRRAVGE